MRALEAGADSLPVQARILRDVARQARGDPALRAMQRQGGRAQPRTSAATAACRRKNSGWRAS